MKSIILYGLVQSIYCRNYSSDSDNDAGGVVGPFFALVFGIILIISAFPCLWFNERRLAISSSRILAAKRRCKPVNCLEVDPRTHNELIHVKGKLATSDSIIDQQFQVEVRDSVKLRRRVETFQWVQKSRQEGSKNNKRTVYYYETSWEKSIQGSYPGHENYVADHTVQEQELQAQNVYIGAYKLTDYLKNKVDDYQTLDMKQEYVEAAKQCYIGRTQPYMQVCLQYQRSIEGKYISFKKAEYQLQIGDQRVWFEYAPCRNAAIVAKQHNETFKPYLFNDKYSEEITPDMVKSLTKFHEVIEEEEPLVENETSFGAMNVFKNLESPINYVNWYFNRGFTLEQCFQKKLTELKGLTNLCRFGGYCMMVIGFILFFSPITTLTYYLPLIGGFVSTLTSYLVTFFSAILSLPLTIGTIGLAWIYYRPVKGLLITSVAVLAGWGCYHFIQHQ